MNEISVDELELTKKLNKVLEDIKFELENTLSTFRNELLEKFQITIEESPEEKIKLDLLNEEYKQIKSLLYPELNKQETQDNNVNESIDNNDLNNIQNDDNIIISTDEISTIDGRNQVLLYELDKESVLLKKFCCTWPECNYKTKLRGNLQKHYRTHTGEKPYKCHWEGCQYRCSDPKSIKDHIRCIHTKEKNYSCSFPGCDRTFGRPYEVKVHYLKHHQDPEDWPHKCQWPGCDRSFLFPKELDKHVLHHTGERPFKCDFENCKATFNHSSVLSRHRKEFHAPKVVNVCGYDGCTSKYLRQRDLDQHVKRVHLGILGPKKSDQKKKSLITTNYDHDYLQIEEENQRKTTKRKLITNKKTTKQKTKNIKSINQKTKIKKQNQDIKE